MSAARHWLDVPYQQRQEAKAAGARWDPKAKRWYSPRAELGALARFSPQRQDDLLQQLVGEDRTYSAHRWPLYVDMLPSSTWQLNARAVLSDTTWRSISRAVRQRAGGRCELCSHAASQAALHAHERFAFDLASRTQRLVRLLAACESCHEAIHYGRASAQGRANAAIRQLARVNGVSDAAALEHAEQAVTQWHARDQVAWSVDLSILRELLDAQQAPLVIPAELAEPARSFIQERLPAIAAALPPPCRITGLLIHPHDAGAIPTHSSARVDSLVFDLEVDRGVNPGQLQARITFTES